MSRTKKPHVVFYVDEQDEIDVAYHDVARRGLTLHKKIVVAPFHLIIYAGRLGEDLKYVETV